MAFMTDEDLKRLVAAKTRSQGSGQFSAAQPGQVSPAQLAAAMRDTEGDQAGILNMRNNANKMAMQPGAQGIQAGNVYAAPSWAAQLADAVRGGTAGYMNYKAGQNQQALNDTEDAKAGGNAAIAARDQQQKQDATQFANDRALTTEDQGQQRINIQQSEAVARAGEAAAKVAREEAREKTRIRERGEDLAAKIEAGELDQKERIELEEIKASLESQGLSVGALEGLPAEQVAAIKNLKGVGERKYASTILTTMNSMNDVIGDANKALEAGTGYTGKEELKRSALDIIVPKGLEKAVRGFTGGYFYGDDNLALKGRIGNAWENIKRARTGANLTAIEEILGADYNPTAEGISLDQAVERMNFIQEWMNTDFESRGIPPSEITQRWQPGQLNPTPTEHDPSDIPKVDAKEMTEAEFMALPEKERMRILGL